MKPLFCAIVAVGSLPVAITAFAQSSFAPANAPNTNPTAAVPCRAVSDLPANPRTGFQGTSYVDVAIRRWQANLRFTASQLRTFAIWDCQECPNVSIRAITETPSQIDLEQKRRS